MTETAAFSVYQSLIKDNRFTPIFKQISDGIFQIKLQKLMEIFSNMKSGPFNVTSIAGFLYILQSGHLIFMQFVAKWNISTGISQTKITFAVNGLQFQTQNFDVFALYIQSIVGNANLALSLKFNQIWCGTYLSFGNFRCWHLVPFTISYLFLGWYRDIEQPHRNNGHEHELGKSMIAQKSIYRHKVDDFHWW